MSRGGECTKMHTHILMMRERQVTDSGREKHLILEWGEFVID